MEFKRGFKQQKREIEIHEHPFSIKYSMMIRRSSYLQEA
jgi:hypothetical protein